MSSGPSQPEADGFDDLDERGQPDESPHHGFQGDRDDAPAEPVFPNRLTVAVSREAGARGGTIAKRVGRALGWEVYDQEMLEYMANELEAGRNPFEEASEQAEQWVETRLEELLREQTVSQHPMVINLARAVLTLGARGEVVLIGRGAGFLLPRPSTMHVRVIAPEGDRITYLSQYHRLTLEEAAEELRKIDQRRIDYIATHFHRQPENFHQYDLLLNSSYLGAETCSELLVAAARAFAKRIETPQDMREE